MQSSNPSVKSKRTWDANRPSRNKFASLNNKERAARRILLDHRAATSTGDNLPMEAELSVADSEKRSVKVVVIAFDLAVIIASSLMPEIGVMLAQFCGLNHSAIFRSMAIQMQ
jgi:hypothetical protein